MMLSEGMILNNRYKILSLAGQGGMARVYKAEDLQSKHLVAIKALKDELNHDEEFVRRFDLEARAAASLSHPNIVKVYGLGEDKGLRYIAQEYVEGHSLKDEIREQGRLDWHLAAPIAIQIALALEHAHNRGIIHRDIKPANILLTEDGIAMVTDFGIARAVHSNTVGGNDGSAWGSVHYFSPEQARGSAVSNKTDIYSLGILMYEMLCGKVPFDGDSSVAVAVKQMNDTPKRPREIVDSIPQGFEDIILRCMQKQPAKRYPDARRLIDDLDAFIINPNGRYGIIEQSEGESVEETPVKPESTFVRMMDLEKDIADRRQSRIRDTILAVAVALLCIVGVVIGLNYLWKEFGSELQLTTRASNSFLVKNYKNFDFQEVARMLDNEGINYRVIYAPDEQIAEGCILDQNIKAGTSINRDGTYISGNELILTVSEGSSFVLVPDIADLSGDAAEAALRERGLNVIRQSRFSLDVPAGMVISISPPSGSKMKKGERVDLSISKGRNTDPLPNVFGVQVTAAAQQLNALGYDTSIVIPSYLQGQETSLYVISMDPPAKTANVTGPVKLHAATYQEVFPSPTPTPEPTTEESSEETTEAPTDPTPTPVPETEAPTPSPEPSPTPEPTPIPETQAPTPTPAPTPVPETQAPTPTPAPTPVPETEKADPNENQEEGS